MATKTTGKKLSKEEYLEYRKTTARIMRRVSAVLAIILIVFSVKTTILSAHLFCATDSVVFAEEQSGYSGNREYADETYESASATRQSLYNSNCKYTRWFSYTMGLTNLRRLVSILIYFTFIIGAATCVYLYCKSVSLTLKLQKICKQQKHNHV